MLPKTASRVERNTAEAINQRIARQTEERIRFFAANPHQIHRRLKELDDEWDMERTLETNASSLALIGVLLGAFVNKRFLALPALVAAFLLQHALQGWCPHVPILRRNGVRTGTEIERERYALKALRGYFQPTARGADNDTATAPSNDPLLLNATFAD
jgi:hypothetical protein